MNDTSAKKDVTKLQRAIVDALEDVKAQDIQVFDTEHLSALFERVVVASGTSNRQTKALAASVRDKVREAGFPKPRIEGEDNGEWIIVDCGAAVAHVMQPTIRVYYNLEELWGDKPLRLKFGADKPAAPASAEPAAKKVPAKRTRKTATPEAEPAAVSPKEAAQAVAKKAAVARKPRAAATGDAPRKRAPSRKKAAEPAVPVVATVVVPAAAKRAARKSAAKSAGAAPAARKSAPRAKKSDLPDPF